MISPQDRDGVVVLEISHGRANAMDVALLQGLARELDQLPVETTKAVVLTGTGEMFSAGINLPMLLEEGPDYAFELIDALNGLLEKFIELSIPSVAAINGHAIAGGFVLASACDFRLMTSGRGKVGLTELLVGVPFPPVALEVVRSAVGDRSARRMVLHGELFDGAAAERLGLVDELADPTSLLDRAVEIGDRLGRVPSAAFQLTKRQLMAPLRLRLERLGDRQEQEARQAWVSSETLEVMAGFVRDRLG